MDNDQPATSEQIFQAVLSQTGLTDGLKFLHEAHRLELDRAKLETEKAKLQSEAARPSFDAVIRFAELAIRSLLLLSGGSACRSVVRWQSRGDRQRKSRRIRMGGDAFRRFRIRFGLDRRSIILRSILFYCRPRQVGNIAAMDRYHHMVGEPLGIWCRRKGRVECSVAFSVYV